MTQNSAQDSAAGDERAIRDLVATWMEASRAGDTAKVLSLMAEDVIFQVPGREPFGKAAFAAMSEGMKGVRMVGSSDIRELRACRDHLGACAAATSKKIICVINRRPSL